MKMMNNMRNQVPKKKKKEQDHPEHHTESIVPYNACKQWIEARETKVNTPRPRDRFFLDEHAEPSSPLYDWENVTLLVHRAIVTLQDKWDSSSHLDDDTAESPGLEDLTGVDIYLLHSCFDHCLTKSRFYIPAPDWSETTPLELSIGIGPAEMEPGDQVAILFGCRNPAILRPEGSAWLYVGPAYAQEMMNGDFVSYWEFLREQGLMDSESEVFEIQ
jgi:hypothetical protein